MYDWLFPVGEEPVVGSCVHGHCVAKQAGELLPTWRTGHRLTYEGKEWNSRCLNICAICSLDFFLSKSVNYSASEETSRFYGSQGPPSTTVFTPAHHWTPKLRRPKPVQIQSPNITFCDKLKLISFPEASMLFLTWERFIRVAWRRDRTAESWVPSYLN